jgi:hypothetical protein
MTVCAETEADDTNSAHAVNIAHTPNRIRFTVISRVSRGQ